jgi:quercetin dioxygenase-like cupin family protein
MRFSSRTRPLVIGTIAALAGIGAAASSAVPSSAKEPPDEPPQPIAIEELTQLDGSVVRGSLSDAVSATLQIAHIGSDDAVTVEIPDLSNVAVERITFQPGAQLPWHTHVGPNIATVLQGEIVYMGDDCVEHSYPAGTTFVDPGHGHVHTAMNPTAGETVVLAVHLEAPAAGPTRVTDGVTTPACPG